MKASFQASPDTIILAKRIEKSGKGETVSYSDFNALCPGRDFQGKDRHILVAAQKKVQRDLGIVTAAVKGVGIKRLLDSEIVDIPQAVNQRTARASKKAMQKVATVEYENLSEGDKRKYESGMTTLGIVALFSSPKVQKLIDDKVYQSKARLSIEDTLNLFKDSNRNTQP